MTGIDTLIVMAVICAGLALLLALTLPEEPQDGGRDDG